MCIPILCDLHIICICILCTRSVHLCLMSSRAVSIYTGCTLDTRARVRLIKSGRSWALKRQWIARDQSVAANRHTSGFLLAPSPIIIAPILNLLRSLCFILLSTRSIERHANAIPCETGGLRTKTRRKEHKRWGDTWMRYAIGASDSLLTPRIHVPIPAN